MWRCPQPRTAATTFGRVSRGTAGAITILMVDAPHDHEGLLKLCREELAEEARTGRVRFILVDGRSLLEMHLEQVEAHLRAMMESSRREAGDHKDPNSSAK